VRQEASARFDHGIVSGVAGGLATMNQRRNEQASGPDLDRAARYSEGNPVIVFEQVVEHVLERCVCAAQQMRTISDHCLKECVGHTGMTGQVVVARDRFGGPVVAVEESAVWAKIVDRPPSCSFYGQVDAFDRHWRTRLRRHEPKPEDRCGDEPGDKVTATAAARPLAIHVQDPTGLYPGSSHETAKAPTTCDRGPMLSVRQLLRPTLLTLATCGLAIWPVLRSPSVDSFPHSTYPMFSHNLEPVSDIDLVVGLNESGATVTLSPEIIAGTEEVIVAGSLVRQSVNRGNDATQCLCREVAARIATAGSPEVQSVQVRTETLDAIGWFQGNQEPLHVAVRATCEVGP
jgi:hypothetical protein